jgi:hypothetical protein
LLRFPDVPLIALGVGSGGPGFVFTPVEREIYLRENTLIVCRNPMLADEINDQLGPGKAVLMPCPAFFCSPTTTPRSIESLSRSLPAVNVQNDSVENQAAPADFVERLIRYVNELDDPTEIRFVAHYVDEFFRFSRLRKNLDLFYSYEPLDFVEYYRDQIRALVASRLHGAIATISSGTPACVVNFGSSRMNNACIPFGPHLPCLPFDDAVEWLRLQTPETLAETSAAIVSFKREMFDRYVSLLTPFISRHLLTQDARERAPTS